MNTFGQDLRYAFRMLAKSPGVRHRVIAGHRNWSQLGHL
jgi:hypothetical protein